MAKRSREKPPLIVRREKRGLSPVSATDAEDLLAFPLGTEFDLVPRTKRSWPQLRTYWKALGIVVKATDQWASAEHLHDALKRDLGYFEICHDLNGKPFIRVDSAALDKMGHAAFCAFMDKAMARLSEVVGFDPLGFLSEAA